MRERLKDNSYYVYEDTVFYVDTIHTDDKGVKRVIGYNYKRNNYITAHTLNKEEESFEFTICPPVFLALYDTEKK